MARNPTNRVSPEKRAIAERMKQVWQRKKNDLGLTQTSVAERLDMSQSAFSQYLNGYVASNTDLVIRLANVLGVDPKEIDPKILVSSAPRITLVPRQLLSRGGLMGDLRPTDQAVTVLVDESIPHEDLAVVVIDTDHYAPRYFTGEHLALQLIKPADAKEGDELLVQWPDDLNELYRAGQRVADVQELMDVLNPGKQQSSLQIYRFDGTVYRVVGRA